jgi:ribonuclease HI
MLEAYFDGSSCLQSKTCGIGVVIKINQETIKKCAEGSWGCGSYEAELKALKRLSEELGKMRPIGHVAVLGDCAPALNAIKRMILFREEPYNPKYVRLIKQVAKNLSRAKKAHYHFIKISRQQNTEANRLAKIGRECMELEVNGKT